MKKVNLIGLSLLLLLATTITSCKTHVDNVILNKTTLNLVVGEKETLTVKIEPKDASNQDVIWTSSNAAIASVSQNGEVVAKEAGEPVTITVTAVDGGKTDKCIVNVEDTHVPVTGISLNKTTLELKLGTKETLKVTVTPENATNKNVVWSSGDNTIVSVSENGEIDAKKAGTATISVKTADGDKTAECVVTVIDVSVAVGYIQAIANEFLQGKSLPRSFTGSSSTISDQYQKDIAEQGVIIYDLAVLLKALMLYPDENREFIKNLVNALKTGTDIRSNSDFTYGVNIPVGKGYFYKIIHVEARWLPGQTLPITGENAWIASAFASVHKAFPSTDFGQSAYNILKELAEAMLSLQTDEGLVRMAPKEPLNYAGYGVNYNATVSFENNLSVIPVFRYLAENATAQADKTKYQNALSKLENALLNLYNSGLGYFNTGLNLESGIKNDKFASDCQTWAILAFGVERLNNLMKSKYNIDNASLQLLKNTLNIAGVMESGKYIGVDFSSRHHYVSFEWSLGFLSAAKQVLARTSDAQLQEAVNSISAYINSRATDKGILTYVNTDEIITTEHGWNTTPMFSLASSAWNIFEHLNAQKTPFDI